MISQDDLQQALAGVASDLPDAQETDNEASEDRMVMDDVEFQEVVRRELDNARSIMDETTLPEVERAWRYYNGEVDQEPMGYIGTHQDTGAPAYEGSKTVLTDCKDQVQTLLPDIYRIIAGSEEAVTFTPESKEDTEYVEQVNDYIRHLFWDKNNGENLVKDSLLEWSVKYTAMRIWRENSHRETLNEVSDLDQEQLNNLRNDQSVTIESVEPYQIEIPVPVQQSAPHPGMPGQPGQPGGGGGITMQMMPMQVFKARCRHKEPVGKTRVALIPQDELIIDLEAQSAEDAMLIGIDADRRASDLIAMGLDREKVRAHAGKGLRRGFHKTDIRRLRSRSSGLDRSYKDTPDPALHWVRVVDVKIMVDRNGDGIAEPWRVIALGDPLEVVSAVEDPGSDEIVVGSPFPRPHYPIGTGIVEETMDLQEIGTSIMRRTLDNFARSINPRAAVSGATEDTWDGLSSWFSSDPINLGTNGRIDWMHVPFNGDTAMPLLGFFDQRRTLRTGISAAAQGLDPRALKGQTLDAVAGIMAAPQSRHEGLAREYCKRVLAPVFKALLRITVRFQDRKEIIRLRNKFVEVDPHDWNAEMDAQVEVGQGSGSRLERMIGITKIIEKQEQLYTAESPLFDVEKYRQALADLTHALGIKDDTRYFPEMDDQTRQKMDEQAKQKQQAKMQQTVQMHQAIEQAKAQAKAQAEIAVEQAKAKLELVQEQIEQAAKQRDLTVENQWKSKLLDQEQMWKARLLELEASLEARVAAMLGRGAGGAGSNANIRRPT